MPQLRALVRRHKIGRGYWVSKDFYEDKAASYNQYDPESWWETINYRMTPFMLIPWLLLTIECTGIAVVATIFPHIQEYLVAMPIDAHVVMGGALSFLLVFRTNAAFARFCAAADSFADVLASTRNLSRKMAVWAPVTHRSSLAVSSF